MRPGSGLGEASKVGAYCGVKNAKVGPRRHVPHLSYVGPAGSGEGANLAAGTITANYDGKDKHRTKIGDSVFTGINTSLIAPVTIGENAYLGAGSVVNKNIPPGKLAVGMPARVIRDAPGSPKEARKDVRKDAEIKRKRPETRTED